MARHGARAWLIPFVEPPSSRREAFRLTNAVVGREGRRDVAEIPGCF